MKFHSTLPFRASVIGLAVHISGAAAQFAQEYFHDIYNSNLACSDQCKANYAFAVVQYQNCWCTNYIPADQQSIGSCNESCPGYPDDNCGSEKAGLFGYIALSNVQPSGTAGAGSSSAASSAASSTTAPSTSTELLHFFYGRCGANFFPFYSFFSGHGPQHIVIFFHGDFHNTTTGDKHVTAADVDYHFTADELRELNILPHVNAQPVIQHRGVPASSSKGSHSIMPSSSARNSQKAATSESTSSYIAPTTSTAPATSSSSFEVGSLSGTTNLYIAPGPVATEEPSSSITPSATPSPVTSVRVVTVSGARVTQTVTSTPIIAGGAQADASALHRDSLSDGAIAGVVIGSLLGVAAILIAAFLLWRRKNKDTNGDNPSKPFAVGNMKRNVSVLSKTGLLSRGRPASVAEREYDEPSSLRRSIMLAAGGAGLNGVSSVSPLGSSHGDTGSQHRHNRPMVYDQRLNPSAIFANQENGSRLSIQDQQDYSRPLGVTNPDIRPSFESRDSRLY
ncbi:hypothetical protein B0A50_03102 [Salinomyces thailandicus]|uniref:WSC domain-containing protein n=1 Tax=Salinomyces thailandicus TaxID=706561 RepID=A0A4V5N4Z2_9PEZI|nr:hypothetical protein B0A50_03102 [Salinomyces thailandica]